MAQKKGKAKRKVKDLPAKKAAGKVKGGRPQATFAGS